MKVKVLRPIFAESASKLVNAVSKYEETVLIKKDHWVVDAKSLLGILAIALQPDQEIEISVSTQNEQVVNELVELGLVAKV